MIVLIKRVFTGGVKTAVVIENGAMHSGTTAATSVDDVCTCIRQASQTQHG